MKIDLLIVQIAILLLPGIIWARLDAKYAMKASPSDAEFVVRSMMFGLASYAVTFLLYGAFGKQFIFINFEDASTKYVVNKDVVYEILVAMGVGIVLSVLWIYAATYKLLTRFLQTIRATKTYGDEDVWDYTFNSPLAAVEYVHFRDMENKVIYAGWVSTFSESEKLRELVLRDVQVYNFDGDLQFEVPLIYLARKPENIHIEFPYRT